MIKNHPYLTQPQTAFWSRSVSENFSNSELLNNEKPLISKGDAVVSAGSCFASNMIPYLESAGIEYIRTETYPKMFQDLGENLGYANFSARYGNIYTTRQLLQLYLRTLGLFKPFEDRWEVENKIIDPLRPGLKFPSETHIEFDLVTKSHLRKTRKAFESANIFVFTLGLTEAWVSKEDGTTYPACPGTIAGVFDEKKYKFHNFSIDEIVTDLSTFIEVLRRNNPKIKFIFTVSPVPLVATASKEHVLVASTYSKSVLRVAAQEVTNNYPDSCYFPAYEIITGPQAAAEFFEPDKRNVSQVGIRTVMEAFLSYCDLENKESKFSFKKSKKNDSTGSIEELSKRITQVECDEVMLDSKLTNN